MHLAAIHIFPIKSCAPCARAESEVQPRGLADDRRWMLVDAQGRFITGRQVARTVLLRAMPTAAGLRLEAPGAPPFELARPAPEAARRQVSVWKDTLAAPDAGDAVAQWLQSVLGCQARLVYMDEAAVRPVDAARGRPGDEVSFADGYPLLAITQAALDGLNARLAAPVPMLRFRPNLVIAGAAAHAEDGWRRLRVGEVEFQGIKPCVRCVFTTVDPASGTRDPHGEPLRTLKTYRRTPDGVTFGMNLVPRGRGTVRVGDAVEVLA